MLLEIIFGRTKINFIDLYIISWYDFNKFYRKVVAILKTEYKYKENYPLCCYSGDMGDFISMTDNIIDVGGYDEFNPLPIEVVERVKERYKGKYRRMFWGYILFRGNPNLSVNNEYILDSVCHPYFEIVNGDDVGLYTIMYYKGEYYLTFLDMYIQDGMTGRLLESDFVITEVEDGTIGMTIVEDTEKPKFKKVKKLEKAFLLNVLNKTGDLGAFIKRVAQEM